MTSWNGKRVLVTGAGGFIGSHLVEELVRAGASVRAMIRYNGRSDWGSLAFVDTAVKKSVDVIAGDIRDPFFVDRAVQQNDVVFHLAALIAIPFSYIAPQSYIETNVSGTLNVLEACRRHEVRRLVQTSTSEVYGTALYTPIDEKHPLQGQSPYSASKIAADKLAESYYRSFDLPVSTIRPFNTYGARQSARAIIPAIISQALSSSEVQLGSLDPVRDLTHVSDTVRGFLAVGECDAAIGDVTNIGSGKSIAIGDLAMRILRLIGSSARITINENRVRPARSEVANLICDNRKAETLLDWRPRVTLDQGLMDSIEWVRAEHHRFQPSVYTV